jgi:putative ABC transport system substrate-binding protein
VRRRDFIALWITCVAFLPRIARAQATPKVVRVGTILINPRTAPFWAAFDRRLRELGYIDGQNLITDFVDTLGHPDRVGEIMKDLVSRHADIILAGGPEIVLKSAVSATKTVPIVMVAVDYDPLALGYVSSLAHPGGNVTGLFFQQIELAAKRAEFMKEALPGVRRATVFWDRLSADQWHAVQNAQTNLDIEFAGVDVGDPPYDYEQALNRAPSDFRGSLIVMTSPLLFRDRARLAQFATQHQLPSIFAFREWVEAGGLMSYGPSLNGLYRRAADYIDQIAKGAKPSDLPIEQPTKFDLVINMRTARTIGFSVPTSLLLRADEVIE